MANLDTGNTGFMLLCSSLVMLMTPGLAFFYGGLVSRRNVLAIMMQSFVSMGWTTVLWFVVGYSLCFSGDVGGVIGNLDMAFLHGVTLATPSPTPGIPLLVHIAYQMMFAIITPALITGAFANRVTFKAYMAFLTLWLLFVYFPFVHMIWGGGILQRWGVLDFAGGIVVHNTAGMAALASVLYVGRRRVMEGGPHSVPLVALGHRPALVRLVRLQCRQRVPGRFGDRGRLPQYRRRGVLRRHHLDGGRLVAGEAADLRRPADGGGGRPRHDHAGGGLRLADHRRDHRDRLGRGLLFRRRAEEQAALGRCARRLGRSRRRRRAGHRAAGRLRLDRVQSRRHRRLGRSATGPSSASSCSPSRSRPSGPSASPTECCG